MATMLASCNNESDAQGSTGTSRPAARDNSAGGYIVGLYDCLFGGNEVTSSQSNCNPVEYGKHDGGHHAASFDESRTATGITLLHLHCIRRPVSGTVVNGDPGGQVGLTDGRK